MCCCDSLYSLEYGIIDSLNLYRISSNVHIENDSWAPYFSVVLGAVLTFVVTILINYINDCKQRKKEKKLLLCDFWNKILEADRYVGTTLLSVMQTPGSQKFVNEFGNKITNLELLLEQNKIMIENHTYQKIRIIKDLMFEYQLSAMNCINYIEIANNLQGNMIVNYQNKAENAMQRCQNLRTEWQNASSEFEQIVKNASF